MKNYIIILYLIVSFSCCSRVETETSQIMDKAALCIEQYPDSSLIFLNTLKLENLPTKMEKARYALLKSMALDKNYIDVTDDSLTSIALAYYKAHGTQDEKLKAYYYHGKVNWYGKNYDRAVENYIKAEKFVKYSEDFKAISRLYNAKALVYRDIYDLDQSIKPAELSAYYYLQAKDTVGYIRALNSLSGLLLGANNFNSLEQTFQLLESFKSKMNSSHMNSYYVNIINYKVAIKDSSLRDSIEEYLITFKTKENIVNWIVLARAYNELKEYANAISALKMYELYNGELSDLYRYFASEVYSAVGDYEKAYKYLKIHNDNSSKENIELFKSDAKFIEERYASNEKQLKQKYLNIFLGLIIVIVSLIVVLVYKFLDNINREKTLKIRQIEEQKDRLNDEYQKAINEHHRLRTLILQGQLTDDVVKLLEERLKILNKFIVSDLSGINMEKPMQELRNYLKDSENFIESTRLSFEVTHPKFICYLKNSGLTKWEMGYCCLYCIGLNGNEISNYMNIKHFYKQSSAIRRKLGVQSMNIDKFLLAKLKEYY